MIKGIDNIGICTTDTARSVVFYQRLGFSEAYRNDRGVLMTAGSAHLFIFATRQNDPPPVVRQLGLFDNPPGIDHISLAVADRYGQQAYSSAVRPRTNPGVPVWSVSRTRTVTTSTSCKSSRIWPYGNAALLRCRIDYGLSVCTRRACLLRVHNYPPRWNAAPSQELLVIRRNHKTGEVSLDPLRGS